MKLVKPLLLFCSILFFGQSQAQDIHWTMFDMSPLTLNPANTGAYEGTFRVGGIYRSQWNSASSATGFETPSFYVDAPILMIGKRSWLAVGGMIYSDEAGTLSQQTVSAMGSAAIHFGLNKKATSVLTIGLQGGTVQKSLKYEDGLVQDDLGGEIVDLIGSGTAMTLEGTEEGNVDYLDFAAGVKLTSKMSKTSDVTVGMTFRHLTTPTQAFSNATSDDLDDLPLLFTFHNRFNFALNKKWNLSPALIFNRTAKSNEFGLQALVGYHLDEKQDMTLHFGPGFRATGGDAVEAILKFDYKQFRVGAAYDFNVSDLSTVTNGVGGFEIAASYIARIYKKPTVKPVIFCPKF